MNHPTKEELLPLLQAVDTACWCLAVKEHTRKGTKCKVNWKESLSDLQKAWEDFQIKMDDRVLTIAGDKNEVE